MQQSEDGPSKEKASVRSIIKDNTPKKTEEGRVKVDEDPDWDNVPLSDARGPDLKDEPEIRRTGRSKGFWVKISKSAIGEAQMKHEEHPD